MTTDQAITDFTCCFCGADCHADTSDGGSVLHVMPMCKKFEEMDPLEFVIACRKHMEKGGARVS